MKRYGLFTAVACLVVGGYWLMLDTVFHGNIVTGIVELVNPPAQACIHQDDGSRICMPIPAEASAEVRR